MQSDEHAELKRLLEETRELTRENNKLLKSIRRMSFWEMVLRIVWYAILIGFPFAIYYYVLGPYFSALGASYDGFSAGLKQLPGVKELDIILKH